MFLIHIYANVSHMFLAINNLYMQCAVIISFKILRFYIACIGSLNTYTSIVNQILVYIVFIDSTSHRSLRMLLCYAKVEVTIR